MKSRISARKLLLKSRKYLIAVVILLAVFAAGYAPGQGGFSFDSSALPENSSLPASLNYSSVNQVYQVLKDNYDGKLTTTQLLNGLKHGLAEATGDPHTEYFTASEAKQFDNELDNSFSGIGAEVGKDSAGDLQIIAPIKGFPA
ncbi:MAG: S41 family peptidase, partial [Candidatus Saccharimonadales bacterium]